MQKLLSINSKKPIKLYVSFDTTTLLLLTISENLMRIREKDKRRRKEREREREREREERRENGGHDGCEGDGRLQADAARDFLEAEGREVPLRKPLREGVLVVVFSLSDCEHVEPE